MAAPGIGVLSGRLGRKEGQMTSSLSILRRQLAGPEKLVLQKSPVAQTVALAQFLTASQGGGGGRLAKAAGTSLKTENQPFPCLWKGVRGRKLFF